MYFRTDMNVVIASGHVMRCLAIAEGFKRKGEPCTFILSDDNAVALIEDRGFQTIVMHSQWNCLEAELPYITEYVKEHSVEKIIVDTYSATAKYLRELNMVTQVVYIDDLQQEEFSVNTLLAFCLSDEGEDFLQRTYRGDYPRVLMGSKYVPLRDEFKDVRKREKPLLYDVMITTGGTDTYGIAEQLVEEFQIKYPQLKLLVLSARMDEACSNDTLKILPFSNQMAELMVSSKVVISAAGGTLNEVCACQVPTVAFSFADNQIAFAKRLHRMGAVIYVGDARCHSSIVNEMIEEAYELLQDVERYKAMVNKMATITDGYGVERIVFELMKNE